MCKRLQFCYALILTQVTLLFVFDRGENPLAHYRPEGPIKFNVHRAQQAQQAMGIPASYPGYSPQAINGYSPAVNGYTSPQQPPAQSPFPWNASVVMQGQPVRNVDYESFY